MWYTEQLRILADRCGVATSYEGWDKQRKQVSDSSLQHILGALGVNCDTSDTIAQSLHEIDEKPWRRTLPPVLVITEGSDSHIPVHIPHGTQVRVWVTTEQGARVAVDQVNVWTEPREVDGVLIGRATFAVPATLPTGWHSVHAEPDDGAPAVCSLVVTPKRLTTADRFAADQRWGLAAQLYSIRSRRSWGIGDLADLSDIAHIAGSVHGADFVLVNPLHAAQPQPPLERSPYLPTTRRFVNPLYIRVEDIPEAALLPETAHRQMHDYAAKYAKSNADPNRIRRNSVYRAKLQVLETIFRVPLSPHRRGSLDRYLNAEGEGLLEFATWCALIEKYGAASPKWRKSLRDPSGVAESRIKLADRIGFYSWLQWICDEQLASAQEAATDAGMSIGIIHDLAVGVQQGGADAWVLGDALTTGVSVGAPPDAFNQQGQVWNQPPWHPWRLAEHGYVPFRDMLRTVLRRAGGLRIDHILGFFRLWWIPEGESAAAGTYVTFDHEALIGILVLEAQRADAVVIGEDLGVFEPIVQDYLSARGVLGTSILWFEHGEFAPIPPENYRTLCLTSVNTHDLPPTAGYLAGEHIRLRAELGLLEQDEATERADDARDREAILQLARDRGLLAADADEVQTVDALHALIARSPSILLSVALADAVGERRIQNQPGTDETQYSNWSIPLADGEGNVVGVEDLIDNARFTRLVRALRPNPGGDRPETHPGQQ
ncbi:4-alpha-glucanotransferase [Williamsia sp. 1135]|uniref:4-alpha-glucanotransferase n=1 Tax=Williamsia sp. 1135 TaxID=1889262 RepID=UPI000A114AC9|nr:4-alpha-glucanotransferase [Williamsia sp. 1135]ORM24197.1 4-alpha-glucanotransferase [Williamsia sp. 1135]